MLTFKDPALPSWEILMAEGFFVDTYGFKYEHKNDQYSKKFIPMFPQLYLKNNISENEPGKYNEFTKYNIDNVDCVFYNKFGKKN